MYHSRYSHFSSLLDILRRLDVITLNQANEATWGYFRSYYFTPNQIDIMDSILFDNSLISSDSTSDN